MNEFRAENLQPLPQFFDVMLNIFFYGGSFMKPITDVDVHEHLKLANEERKPVLSKAIVHPDAKWKRGFAGVISADRAFRNVREIGVKASLFAAQGGDGYIHAL